MNGAKDDDARDGNPASCPPEGDPNPLSADAPGAGDAALTPAAAEPAAATENAEINTGAEGPDPQVAPEPPAAGGDERTVFSPMPPPVSRPSVPPPPAASGATEPPAGEPRRIRVGDVLNHMFEVRRFIARGGMGEVFEGINISSEERVAIKVILPHLAQDPAVKAMFRKEARTLTRMTHHSLVQYRVLAQEPQLGVFYIVTEYIEGQNLSDLLGELRPDVEELAQLTRELAEGLASAHRLGAIHRDISPDNIMLEGNRIDRAKTIDFGIAKDLDAASGTIIGDGFAGKLNYVAPEQLGDFDRQIGPWTDVYSLGLTILAVILGRDVDMGGSLVDAIDKRRAGPDLSAAPDRLRPVLQAMLRPDPTERLRSMEEVLERLASFDGGRTVFAPFVSAEGVSVDIDAAASPAPQSSSARRAGALLARLTPLFSGRRGLVLTGGGLAALMLTALVVSYLSPSYEAGDLDGAGESARSARPAPADPIAEARTALTNGLPRVPCSWLDLVSLAPHENGVATSFRGVAGRPADAQNRISKLLDARGVRASVIDFSDVSPVDERDCGQIEAFHAIRDAGGARLSSAQRQFEMVKLGKDAGSDAGQLGAIAIITVDLSGLAGEAALIGMEEDGSMSLITSRKADLQGVEELRPQVYRLHLSTTHKGWSGIVMLSGNGPFDQALLNGKASDRGPDWAERFAALAQQRGWKSDMVWYRIVDEAPN
ncbi:MAG: serine/threonine-protein kinase [Caenibius sp.]